MGYIQNPGEMDGFGAVVVDWDTYESFWGSLLSDQGRIVRMFLYPDRPLSYNAGDLWTMDGLFGPDEPSGLFRAAVRDPYTKLSYWMVGAKGGGINTPCKIVRFNLATKRVDGVALSTTGSADVSAKRCFDMAFSKRNNSFVYVVTVRVIHVVVDDGKSRIRWMMRVRCCKCGLFRS